MAKVGINIKIDVTKLDKARFFKGEKGTYADLTAFVDLDNQSEYGDNGTVTQSVTKEEKQQGVKMPILGNVKVFWRDGAPQANVAQSAPQAPQQAPQVPSVAADDFDDPIPF
jgi:hypothetical protein